MNLSGHRNDSIKQIITPTLPTTSMALTNNTDLPQPYGSETDPVFIAWLASPTGLVKANVGLSNVDNTADLSKPLSTAMTNALSLKQDISNLHTTALSASDTKYPSCTSVKNYADAITSASALLYQTLANLSTNVVTDGASSTKYPSVKAIKDYVDGKIVSTLAHSSTTGLQGGTSAQYYHLTAAQHTVATQSATAVRNGYLTSTDWIRFDAALSGSASSITTASGFTISEISNRLVIKYGGTEIWSISTAGSVKAKDETTAYTTP